MLSFRFYSFLILCVSTFLPSNRIYAKNRDNTVKILGLFGQDEKEEEFVFYQAIDEANEYLRYTNWILQGKSINVASYDSFSLSKNLCSLISQGNGFAAIFGPDYADLSDIVRSITNKNKIPLIDTRWEAKSSKRSEIYVNLYPEATLFEEAISDVLEDMDWETFTLIYESPESLIFLQEVLKEKMGRSTFDRPKIVIKELPENDEDYRPFLKEIKNSSETHIMLHCHPEKIDTILGKANEVDLMGPYQSFFITSLDAHIVNFTRFQLNDDKVNSKSNITTFRLINKDSVQMNQCIQRWRKEQARYHLKNLSITPETIKTDTALMRDAVLIFAQALKDMPKNFTTTAVKCAEEDSYWEFGPKIIEKIRSIEFEGLSGEMVFDTNGDRKYFSLEIIEATYDGFRRLGTWDSEQGVRHARNITQLQLESSKAIVNKTLRVVSKIGSPYLNKNPDGGDGNDAYEGFCKDLLDKLAELKNFNYVLRIADDPNIGELNKETGRYTGLIGELREFRADLAICDFTITPERKKAVDFTQPFMSLGIGILYTVAPERETHIFSFLDPFDITVWIYLATAYLSISIGLYIIGRGTPDEWEGPHPCNQEPEELTNAWNIQNCLWFALGSVLQQGCDILPKSNSARLTASIWWFFTLVMISTYTANLTAFLTTQRMESPIKSAQDLANQDQVKYGCLQKGATSDFFRTSNDSLYQRMWATMEASSPSVFCKTNDEGVSRVLHSKHKYAFFMESSSIEYQMKLNCDLEQIGELLDSKFYGIALPPYSIYRDVLTQGILELREKNVLDELKDKWWRNPQNITCEQQVDEDKNKLGVANVGGVFILLIFGCVVSFFVSLLEFFWNVRKVAVREKIFLSEAFWLELKFAFKCNKTTKPVRHTPNCEPLGTPLSVSQIGFVN